MISALLTAFCVLMAGCGQETGAPAASKTAASETAASETAAAQAVAPSPAASPVPHKGGRLAAALSAEPRTFNPVTAVDNPSLTVIRLLTGDLVHLDRLRQESEPALAQSFEISPDGRRFLLELRPGVRFSDGHPLDADDVIFSFQVYLDAEIASGVRPLLMTGGEPIQVRKLGERRLEFELAQPYAGGARLFDSLAILPEHLLGAAWREGRFTEVWGTSTPPEEIVGLGPFQLMSYVPGERIVLKRNPHYWKHDSSGVRLPWLDELVFVFVANEDARVLRFAAGEIHVIDHLSAENFELLEQRDLPVALYDLGPSLTFNFLFFNLNHGLEARLPEVAIKQRWFREAHFRHALSAAIDRRSLVRLVYRGRAAPLGSHVTPGNKQWRHAGLEAPEYSPERARQLLAEAGFTWDGEDRLRDPQGAPVGFTLVTNSSNEERRRMATIIQEDLRRIGVEVRVVPLEFRALVDRLLNTFDYEAAILGLSGDVDPNHFVNVWRSDGGNRLWQRQLPASLPPWQAEIDRLLDQQMTVVDRLERKKIYDRVQAILAEREPVILLVSPHVLVGGHRGLGNFTPAVIDHSTLWNADEIYWRADPSDAS